ncbi:MULTISPECIES: alpha/beta hydrolase [unclassified Amycolatopsis]|uniref:alpha/beta fold hydrolase n=1 Tax=unclassified Amycolatopsis TaxID=2618356 RepID=UPI002876567C|nr:MULTISPECIES: alpha/beta hydrolase [unclassified Amycolatopsis]MDS0139975.1 alpha/beta hydrolase [Amycolatopsis sp. 505]MDS0148113.1 alpha/beta hydrolase [Amycolatopsis sp. CM201R]
MESTQSLKVNGQRIHYVRAGDGPAVVLLHGSGSSLEGFGRVAALLSSSYDVIRPDLPGFGRTGPRPDRDYRVRTYAGTIARFLTALQVPHFALAGNSLGGNIAWNLALDAPDRVDALVLVNATGYPGKTLPAGLRLARNPLLRPLLRRWLPRGATERGLREAVGARSGIVDAALVDRVHALTSRPGNRSAFVDFANTDQPDRSGELPKLAVPTLVLRSAGVDGQHFARDIPGALERVHADGGHLLPEEDPDWVATAIREFLR